MKLRARVDANQKEIVKLFRSYGCSVACLHQLGKGIPDILVGVNGHNILVEIKDGAKRPSERKLTPDEQEFKNNWKGELCIIESTDDALQLLKLKGVI